MQVVAAQMEVVAYTKLIVNHRTGILIRLQLVQFHVRQLGAIIHARLIQQLVPYFM